MKTLLQKPSRLSFLALLIVASVAPPAPTRAQQIPWIGLAAPGARILGEVGQYPHSPGAADLFGFAVAAGDFNNDGLDDLASGIPGNDCDVVTWDCGSVQVRFGGALAAALKLDPAHPDAPEPAEAFEEYGRALAVGDFDHDGYDDLVVGIPGDWGPDHAGNPAQVGAVQVHFGLPSGIQVAAEQFIQNQQLPLGDRPHDDERFGHALAVGDFDGDGHDDLAIGMPRNRGLVVVPTGELIPTGGVHVVHGHSGGLVPLAGFAMLLGSDGLPDQMSNGDEFGFSLAAGDFNGDGFDDLAIGIPGKDEVGKVLVVYGSPVSLVFPSHRYFGSFELGGESQPGMRFGAVLTAGDFDGDGRDDLAIGAPLYDGQGPSQADIGLVAVVYGPPLDPTRVHWITEHILHGPGNSELFDQFGSALAAGDFNGDGVDDLAIGTPGEQLVPFVSATGAVSVVAGRPVQGLTLPARQLRPAGGIFIPDILDPAGLIPDYRGGEPRYGSSLAAGDFDGNGFADLAIGAPYRDRFTPTHQVDTGAVAVLYGQLFADGFETGNSAAWSSAAP